MVQVTVLYPNQDGTRFDERYYLDTHTPMLWARWGDLGLQEVRLLRGTGTPDGRPAPFRVIALLTFASAEALRHCLKAHGREIVGDIPNFTDVQPVMQVNETLA